MPGDTRRRYPPELKERAVRMVAEIQADEESEWAAMTRVSELLGVGTPETVRKWVRRAEIDAGARPGVTSEESAEVRRLRREVAELRRANSILKAGGCRANRRRGGAGLGLDGSRIVVCRTTSCPGIAIS
jgi:transposase